MSITTEPPLATVADLEAYLGRPLEEGEQAQAEALGAQASAAVRRLCEQTISLVTDDLELHDSPHSDLLLLRQVPVVEVTSIEIEGRALDETSYRVASRTGAVWLTSYPSSWALGLGAYFGWGGRQSIAVTYTHGCDPVPDDIVGVVCAMADRALSQAGTGGIKMEVLGPYRYVLGPNADAGGVGMTSAEAAVIASYRLPQQVIP